MTCSYILIPVGEAYLILTIDHVALLKCHSDFDITSDTLFVKNTRENICEHYCIQEVINNILTDYICVSRSLNFKLSSLYN